MYQVRLDLSELLFSMTLIAASPKTTIEAHWKMSKSEKINLLTHSMLLVSDILMFSMGMKRDHWHEMGECKTPFINNHYQVKPLTNFV